jgi:localization factor PodJL
MSKTTAENDFGAAETQQTGRPPELVCAADDLKGMLAELTRQFADADQRNFHTLRDMRGRLESLGRGAESVRDQVPAHYASAFARIEEGVQSLAERLATASREREIAKAADQLVQPDCETGSIATQREPVSSRDFVNHVPAAAIAAPAVPTKPAPELAATNIHHLAPLPPVVSESVPGDAAEPWDQTSADALASLYDSGEANLAPPPALAGPETVASAATPPQTAAGSDAEALHDLIDQVETPAVTHAGRAWLDERFSGIAARIETSLGHMHPAGAFAAFDQRLEQLETRFSHALEDVATRADVDGLRIVEAHITELAAQFEQAQHQLGRIEMIESQLGEVAHQLSDERFAKLIGTATPAAYMGPTGHDLEAVAHSVAERVVSRMPQTDSRVSGVDPGSIADLKRLVEGFVAGQRDSEEHTSTMLDTMQQAMIRMLDRMDAIENAAPSYQAPQANFGPAPAAAVAPQIEPMLPPPAKVETDPAPANRATAPAAKEDFRAAAVADARRAARRVSAQASDGPSMEPEAPKARRGAPAVQLSVAAPEPEAKARSRTPLMVAGVALIAAIAFLAASVGMNKGLPGTVGQQMSAERAPKMSVDNGGTEVAGQPPTKESTETNLATDSLKGLTPTPQLESNGMPPRAAPAAASPRPGASAVDPRRPLPGGSELATDSAGNQQGMSGDAMVVRQDAALTAPVMPPQGISLTRANAAVPGNSDLARMRQQRNMASLANQLAHVQAKAPTVPASLMPEGAVLASHQVNVDGDAGQPSELPPALIGPTSLRTAAQKGDPSAEFEVAARFAEGRGISQDFKQAIVWYQRSAQRGFAPAQYRLGTLFERGIGTKADPARAKIWYGRAAEQGHIKAMHNLAVLNSGRDQSADYTAALQWFTAAAERGLADSQYNLGVLYESGLGIERDLKQAYLWLSLAARNGDKEAARRRDQVRMKLEEAEVAAADEAVNAWRAKPSDSAVNDARVAGEAWKSRQSAAR